MEQRVWGVGCIRAIVAWAAYGLDEGVVAQSDQRTQHVHSERQLKHLHDFSPHPPSPQQQPKCPFRVDKNNILC